MSRTQPTLNRRMVLASLSLTLSGCGFGTDRTSDVESTVATEAPFLSGVQGRNDIRQFTFADLKFELPPKLSFTQPRSEYRFRRELLSPEVAALDGMNVAIRGWVNILSQGLYNLDQQLPGLILESGLFVGQALAAPLCERIWIELEVSGRRCVELSKREVKVQGKLHIEELDINDELLAVYCLRQASLS